MSCRPIRAPNPTVRACGETAFIHRHWTHHIDLHDGIPNTMHLAMRGLLFHATRSCLWRCSLFDHGYVQLRRVTRTANCPGSHPQQESDQARISIEQRHEAPAAVRKRVRPSWNIPDAVGCRHVRELRQVHHVVGRHHGTAGSRSKRIRNRRSRACSTYWNIQIFALGSHSIWDS